MAPTSTLVARRRSRLAERGAVSAEYALVTAAVIGFGGILFAVLTDPQVKQALMELLLRILAVVGKHI